MFAQYCQIFCTFSIWATICVRAIAFLCLCNVSPSDFSETLENLNWILVHRTFAFFVFFFCSKTWFLYLCTSSVSHCEMALKIYHSPSFHSSCMLTISHSENRKFPSSTFPSIILNVRFWITATAFDAVVVVVIVLFLASSMILECVSFMEFHFALSPTRSPYKWQVFFWIRVSNAYNIRTLHFRHLSTWIFAIETSNAAVVLSFMNCVCAAAVA